MDRISELLTQIDDGDPSAAEHLLPLVYDELRKLAAARLARERPGQTLQATALVHEAYLRLVDSDRPQRWESRAHFFAAVAEGMRRILVEGARKKARIKHGGEWIRSALEDVEIASPVEPEEILGVHEALHKLEASNPDVACLVKLRYFAGMTNREAAESLGVSPRKADQMWAYAKVWLMAEMGGNSL
jgi:RNA polymerase sigma factor (TIGR02999 family)